MKKYFSIIVFAIIIVCALILVSCSNNTKTEASTKNETTESAVVTTVVTTKEETTVVTTKEETTVATTEETTVVTTEEETTVATTEEETTTQVATIAPAVYDIDFENGKAVEKNGKMTFATEGAPTIGETSVKHDGETYSVPTLNIKKQGDGLVCTFTELLTENDMKKFFNHDFTAEVFYVNRKKSSSVQASFCQTESAGWGLAEGASSNGNAPYFIIRLGNGYKSIYADTGAASDSELVHVLGVYDKTFNEIRIYINGEFAGSASVSGDFVAISSTYSKAYRTIVLGADYSKTGTLTEFNMTDCSFVDAKIYDYALEDDEAMIAYKNAVAALGE